MADKLDTIKRKKRYKKKEIRIRIAQKRFLHDYRRKGKKYRLSTAFLNSEGSIWRNDSLSIKQYSDLRSVFLPRNLSYLIDTPNSPFYINRLTNIAFVPKRILYVPANFSIVLNSSESYSFLRKVTESLILQNCEELEMNYSKCSYCDLITQVFLDAILLDYSRFVTKCKQHNKIGYLSIKQFGAIGYYDFHIQRMINSVGSPAVLINRKIDYSEIIPFNLLCFDAKNATAEKRLFRNSIDSTKCIDYVNECLKRVHKTLSSDAKKNLGYVVGETIINAEEHSSLKYRYMVGYFEENKNHGTHFGIFNLIIMNFGQTIYEKFKYPSPDQRINLTCLRQMEELSRQFAQKNFFQINSFSEEMLWTLYALQQGVTCIPDQKRGNGTIQFIESFFNLKGDNSIDEESKMYILSGYTVIEFDGTYRLSNQKDEEGNPRGIISFNLTGSLRDRPDSKYVRQSRNYFPGTAIFVRLQINDDDIQ